MRLPFIGVPCDIKTVDDAPFHAAGDKYIAAAAGGAGGLPLLIPALGETLDVDQVLSMVDGLMLTGSVSNVEPRHYLGAASRPGTLHDPLRDSTTLRLIEPALERGIPVLGICRGFQEINVALGGELHQHVQELPGHQDHREPDSEDLEVVYGPAHRIVFENGSWLSGWLGRTDASVNSLHQQGVKRLGRGLVAEARAEDGLIEAFRLDSSRGFAYAVQWHPEWRYWENPVSHAIFKAFGEACRARQRARA
ncbi:gamma-glutamyl-gamma-aminobutyrate hydrolase family protein [Paludibacterium paludis]|uniref:gamma-glutamyl-gamma-aminobutyrate hydrolase n=1 Tax=Paludibacterium paludis TaxID=1225769 RepID=A0A918U9F1_9NEIS|nr:gamma-glutamyl-gamma-aminobutyrate hydrolase family protein [Paludibacterium paludis]GGY13104.1 glutamine amidotransferase [Paludibacterium paludis]